MTSNFSTSNGVNISQSAIMMCPFRFLPVYQCWALLVPTHCPDWSWRRRSLQHQHSARAGNEGPRRFHRCPCWKCLLATGGFMNIPNLMIFASAPNFTSTYCVCPSRSLLQELWQHCKPSSPALHSSLIKQGWCYDGVTTFCYIVLNKNSLLGYHRTSDEAEENVWSFPWTSWPWYVDVCPAIMLTKKM